MPICNICHKYSSHSNEVDIRTYNILGSDRKFAVCVNPEHPNTIQALTDIVKEQDRMERDRKASIEAEAKRVLEEEQKRQKEHEESVKKDIEQKLYNDSIKTFHQLFPNVRARKEILRLLNEANEISK
jgi:hypothetical protein